MHDPGSVQWAHMRQTLEALLRRCLCEHLHIQRRERGRFMVSGTASASVVPLMVVKVDCFPAFRHPADPPGHLV